MRTNLVDWSALVRAAGRELYPSRSPRNLYRHFKFLREFRRHRATLERLIDADRHGSLAHALTCRPRVLGMLLWPYINKEWSAEERFARFAEHYWQAERHPALALEVGDCASLADLDDVSPGLQIILDRPQWFLREGELSINLFHAGERLYSLAFSLGQVDGADVAYVGGIQGRNIEGVDVIYKEMTKRLHGTRPRDFLVGTFQLLCEVQGIERILAVSDECRHHRHQYFGSKVEKNQSANYDAIWADRGGRSIGGGFIELPARLSFKDEADIPSQKRAQYRRRYALFNCLREAFHVAVPADGACHLGVMSHERHSN